MEASLMTTMQTTAAVDVGAAIITKARSLSLDRTRIQVEDKAVNLSPGMAVTVEIKTGSRTILSYLLSPLARYRHESLRER